MMLREAGALYPAEYLMQVADEGGPLFFKTDREWLDYMLARSVLGDFEEADDE